MEQGLSLPSMSGCLLSSRIAPQRTGDLSDALALGPRRPAQKVYHRAGRPARAATKAMAAHIAATLAKHSVATCSRSPAGPRLV
jgi:hypothetical protein